MLVMVCSGSVFLSSTLLFMEHGVVNRANQSVRMSIKCGLLASIFLLFVLPWFC